MLKSMRLKIKNIKYKNSKKRLIMFGILLISLLWVSCLLLKNTYAKYQSSVQINTKIDYANYIFKRDKMNFSIDTSKIIPSNLPYKYKFSVSNFDDKRDPDLNLEYKITIKTTTNLPLTIKLYRGNDLTNNILNQVKKLQDEDGSWYRYYETTNKYQLPYTKKITDVYTLEIIFPKIYGEDTTYVDSIENIDVILNSNQVV